MINHHVKSLIELKEYQRFTQTHWESKFPEEPWSDDESIDKNGHVSFNSQFEYDIASAVQRQKVFFYQVSLPHYENKTFLEESIKRYEMYLKLKSIYPKEFLVPCYDMDIVWHTHQSKPVDYESETKALVGFHLPHDDSVNNRSPGSKLNNSQAVTEKLWKDTFGVDFPKKGCMFRGNPPQGKLLPMTEELRTLIRNRSGIIYKINSNCIQLIEGESTQGELLRLIERSKGFRLTIELGIKSLTFGGLRDIMVKHFNKFEAANLAGNTLKFDEMEFEIAEGTEIALIDVHLVKESDIWGCLKTICGWSDHVETIVKSYSFQKTVIDNLIMGNNFENTLHAMPGTNTKIKLLGSATKYTSKQTWKKLDISQGSYYDCLMPEYGESLWGPIPLKSLGEGTENNCIAVTHK